MDASALLKKVRLIELKFKSISRNILSGEYHSAFRGLGMSFREVRSYQYGDDIRHVDWNVTARAREPFVKVFEEEREQVLMFLMDVSASTLFGSGEQRKSELMTEICAMLAFSAIQHNDKVGVILFSDKIEQFIPPRKGRFHVFRIIHQLLTYRGESTGTSISEALTYLTRVLKKKAICFVISDFQSTGYELALKIASAKHDIIGIRISDPREASLPRIGLMHIRDPETGCRGWMDTLDPASASAYVEKYRRNSADFQRIFRKYNTGMIEVSIGQPYVGALCHFFRKRTP